MKTIRVRPEIVPVYLSWLCVSLILLWFFKPYWLVNLFSLNFLILPPLLVVLFSKFGQKKVETPTNRTLPVWLWLIKLWLPQLTLLTCVIAIQSIQFTPSHLDPNFSWSSWGWPTWSASLGACAVFAYTYNKKTLFFPSQLISPLWASASDSVFAITMNTGAKIVTTLAFTSLLFFSFLIIASLYQSLVGGPPVFGLAGHVFVAALVSLLLIINPLALKQWQRLTNSLRYRWVLLIFLIAYCIISLLINSGLQHFTTPLHLPHFLTHSNGQANTTVWWQLWWALWIPFLMNYFISISHGYKIKHVIMAGLFLPLVFLCLPHHFFFTLPQLPLLVVGLCFLFITGYFFTDKLAGTYLMQGYFANEKSYRKKRSVIKPVSSLLVLTTLWGLIALPYGVYSLSLLIVVLPLVGSLPYWLLPASLIKLILKHRTN